MREVRGMGQPPGFGYLPAEFVHWGGLCIRRAKESARCWVAAET